MNDRDQMIADAMKSGLSREEASILTDMSKHAFETAITAVMRVIETTPQDLRMPVLASVLGTFADIMRDRFPEHWTAFLANEQSGGEGKVIVLPSSARKSADHLD